MDKTFNAASDVNSGQAQMDDLVNNGLEACIRLGIRGVARWAMRYTELIPANNSNDIDYYGPKVAKALLAVGYKDSAFYEGATVCGKHAMPMIAIGFLISALNCGEEPPANMIYSLCQEYLDCNEPATAPSGSQSPLTGIAFKPR